MRNYVETFHANTVWYKIFWQDICLIENKNCDPSLQSAITRNALSPTPCSHTFLNLLQFLSQLRYRLFSGLNISEKL